MNSQVLNEMIKTKEGYRTESFRGSKVRKIKDIVRFELSMGNVDIMYYMQSAYGILDDLNCNEWEEYVHECQENADYITDEIMEFLEEKLNEKEDDLIGLWLTSYNNVISIYGGDEDSIDMYSLDKDYVIMSDLDSEGALFAFKKE